MIEAIKKVIITREPDRAAPLMAALEPYGVLSYPVSVTRTVFEFSRNTPENLKDFDWIAFTSANAVRGFSSVLKNYEPDSKHQAKIAAVGESTASIIEEAVRKPDLVPEKSDARTLAESIIKNSPDAGKLKVLWPCGADALPDFERVLSGAGAIVVRFECYRTELLNPDVIHSQLQKVAPWDLVFFAAPSAVRAFSDAWEARSDFIAAAIGPTTEKALHEAEYENVVTSKGASVAECAGAIIDALRIKVWS